MSAGYEQTANGCSAGFHVGSTTSDFDIHYAVSRSNGSVYGTALLSASIDGWECEQTWEVHGVFTK